MNVNFSFAIKLLSLRRAILSLLAQLLKPGSRKTNFLNELQMSGLEGNCPNGDLLFLFLNKDFLKEEKAQFLSS